MINRYYSTTGKFRVDDCLTQLVVVSERRGCLTKVQNMKIHDLNFSEHQKKLKSVQ